MRSPGAILLVSCYELGHQPFHLASLAATVQQAGYQPTLVDTAVATLSDETIRAARFIAISVPMHTALRLGEQIALRARALNPTVHICLYGLYALLNADHLLQTTIDSAIAGEYETPLLTLIQHLEQHKEIRIAGVHTRTHAATPYLQRTPFAIPERQHLPALSRYARLEQNGTAWLAGYTETTRGCKHTCLHCPVTPIYQGRFFAVPASIVLADIRAQVAQGARHITFGDPDFWNGPTHALRIVNALHSEFPQVTFDATIKIEHILKHHKLLPEMKAAGCLFIVSAVESLNDTVLLQLDKGHSRADIVKAFALTEQAGISLRPSLLPFSPWETLESYIDLLDFFEQNHYIEHLDPVHLSIRLLIPPGSALLKGASSPTTIPTPVEGRAEKQARHDQPQYTIKPEWLDELDAANYTYKWHHPDPRMDQLQRKVSRLVERAEKTKMDTAEAFFRVKALAYGMQERPFSVSTALQNYGKRKVLPHLTESWFC